MRDLIVVGGGILGATVAKFYSNNYLTNRSDWARPDVLLIDDFRPLSGTTPSGGHMRQEWSGLSKVDYAKAVETLDYVWGVEREEYRSGVKSVMVDRVDVRRVTTYTMGTAERGTVTGFSGLGGLPTVVWVDRKGVEHRDRTKKLVVATGAWTGALLPGVEVTAKQGVSFVLDGTLGVQGLVERWAPYRQIVAHQVAPDRIWVGDGTTIIPANWHQGREADALARCLGAVGTDKTLRGVNLGLRPYAEPAEKDDPCLLRRVYRNVWVLTGAGKRGTIAAGWACRRLRDDLR